MFLNLSKKDRQKSFYIAYISRVFRQSSGKCPKLCFTRTVTYTELKSLEMGKALISVSLLTPEKSSADNVGLVCSEWWTQLCVVSLLMCFSFPQLSLPSREPCLTGLKLGRLLLLPVKQCHCSTDVKSQTEPEEMQGGVTTCQNPGGQHVGPPCACRRKHWHLNKLRNQILSLSGKQMGFIFVLKTGLKKWSRLSYSSLSKPHFLHEVWLATTQRI